MADRKSPNHLRLTRETRARDRWSVGTNAASSSGVIPKVTSVSGVNDLLFDGRYRIERELGAGAMGVVYLAHDVGLDRLVALKVIHPTRAQSEEAVAQLQREARSLATLRHPHVVAVHAFGEHCGAYFFAMEYVEGTDLESVMVLSEAEGRTVPLERTMAILGEVSEGLAAVHKAGLVHRDVKPANILVEEGSERTVLVDFGLADAALGEAGAGGTPAYCPAEQLLGAPSSPAFDVYAFGVLAFELLTGRLPFVAPDLLGLIRLHETAPVPLVSSFASGLEHFDRVIARALDKDPLARYASASEMYRDLVTAAEAHAASRRSAETPLEIGRVLIVSSPGSHRDLVRRAIDTAFFWQPVEVACVASPEAALAEAKARRPDLVVCDAGIPEASRTSLSNELHSTRQGAVIQFLGLPATADMREIVTAIQAVARLAKP